jgi:hypothetical protein
MEQLIDVLSKCTTNPHFLSKAGDTLKDFESLEGYAPALMQIAQTCSNNDVRTLASILLKNLISACWTDLNPNDQNLLKNNLPSVILTSESKVQHLLVFFK